MVATAKLKISDWVLRRQTGIDNIDLQSEIYTSSQIAQIPKKCDFDSVHVWLITEEISLIHETFDNMQDMYILMSILAIHHFNLLVLLYQSDKDWIEWPNF